jgi:hypothetical protein
MMNYTAFVELMNCADLAFVARAVDTSDDHPQFWYMSVGENEEGLSAMATDGKRLHKAQLNRKDVPNVSPGYWRVLKNKEIKTRDHELEYDIRPMNRLVYEREHILWLAKLDKFDLFPPDARINAVFPRGNPLKEGTVDTHKRAYKSINALIKNLPGFAMMNLKHLMDLGPGEWNYKIFTPGKPFLFERENKTALIMPISPA